MKTIIQLLIVAAILHAVGRAALSAMTYYELKDASHEILVFGRDASEDQLAEGILVKASELHVPLQPEALAVRRDADRTVAEASYTETVELLPRYRFPVKYSFRVEALSFENVDSPRTKDVK